MTSRRQRVLLVIQKLSGGTERPVISGLKAVGIVPGYVSVYSEDEVYCTERRIGGCGNQKQGKKEKEEERKWKEWKNREIMLQHA